MENSHSDMSKFDLNSFKILCVEDDDLIGKLLIIHLKKAGFTNCALAINGKEALSIYHRYDIIILDVGLPDIDGCHVCKEIRKQEKIGNRHTPIIGLTAYGSLVQNEALEAGMDEYLTKPEGIIYGDLIEKLYKWVRELALYRIDKPGGIMHADFN